MSTRKKILSLAFLGLVIVALAQACNPTPPGGDESQSTAVDGIGGPEPVNPGGGAGDPPKGNGDYYGGMNPPEDKAMSSSILAVEKTIRDLVDEINPDIVALRAEDCERALRSRCFAGVRIAAYAGCTFPNSTATMWGIVYLKYSDSQCRLETAGDSVDHQYGIVIKGEKGFRLESSSKAHENYLGETLSGGSQLKKLEQGWELTVGGKHIVLRAPLGIPLVDISQKTEIPFVFGADIQRNIFVKSGQLNAYHNKLKMTAAYSVSDLAWDSSCCHARSGLLKAVFDGAYKGQASIEFSGCGNVTVNYGKETRHLTLRACDKNSPDDEEE